MRKAIVLLVALAGLASTGCHREAVVKEPAAIRYDTSGCFGTCSIYTVTAWRALADNCARSLRRGDPVVVHGRLSAQTWTSSAGIEVTSFEVDAIFVGHDLNRGVGQFTRTARPPAEDAVAGPEQGPAPGSEGDAGRGADQAVEAVEQAVEQEGRQAGRAA